MLIYNFRFIKSKIKMKSICIFVLFIICNVAPIYTETVFEEYTQQKYNLVELVQNVALRINANNKLKNSFESPTTTIHNDMKEISSRIFDPLLMDFLLNKTSVKCLEDLLYIFRNIASPGGWAAKMIDSCGKPESGILQGNFKWLGEFNECISVYAPAKENSSIGNFHGQYCSLTVTMQLGNTSLPLSLGTCLPDSCHASAANSSQFDQMNWKIPSSHLLEETKSLLSDTTLTCQPTSRKLTTEAIAVICLISFFILLVVIGSSITAFEHFFKPTVKDCECGPGYGGKVSSINADSERQILQEADDDDVLLLGGEGQNRGLTSCLKKCKPFFNCFCAFTNGAKLLDTSSSEGQLPCLHGIRFLSLSWVIVCHTYAFCFGVIRNLGEIGTLMDNWPFQIILNGFFSVDSFFLLSGFLVAYLFFEQSSKSNGKIPWIYFYVHRYIRLTPVYMMVIAFDTTLSSYLGSGPSWVNYDTEPVCDKNWWWNLLYINNFQKAADQCMAWSWYLANDMQFFVVSPIILVTLWRWPKVGYSVLTAFLFATFLSNIIITYHYNLITGLGNILSLKNMQDFMVKWMDFFNYVYVRPYTRMSPYLVGIALAYYLYRRKQNVSGKDRWVTLGSGWVISSTIVLACLFGTYHQDLTLVESCFYNAFSRTGFALGLAWVIYVCVTGQGGFINSILSFKLFIPLSRLSYCAYLVHPIILMGYFGSLKVLMNFSHMTMVLMFLGFLLMSYCAALVTSLLFESPVIRLDKFVRSKFSRS